MKPKIESGV